MLSMKKFVNYHLLKKYTGWFNIYFIKKQKQENYNTLAPFLEITLQEMKFFFNTKELI